MNVSHDLISMLFENGFDNLESLSFVTNETLESLGNWTLPIIYYLGIHDDDTVQTMLNAIANLKYYARELIEDQKTETSSNKENSPVSTKEKRIDMAMLMKCATNVKHKKNTKDQKAFLQTVTHLSLNGQRITHMGCLD